MYDNHPKTKFIYVGIDCHKFTHTAAVINCFNEQLEILTFNNTKEDFIKLEDMVNKHTTEDVKAIYGLEDTKHFGYSLANFLMARDYQVKHILSNLTYTERQKHPIISKDDELDALCIAKVLLDNFDTLRDTTNDEAYWTLKQIVRMRSALLKDNVKTKNKLHAQLLHHYPNYKDFFANFDGIVALELWEKYPSPDLLLKVSLEELEVFVKRGRFPKGKAQHIYDLVRQEENNHITYQEERNVLIVTLVRKIKANNERMEEMAQSMISLYDKLGYKLHTINGLSKMTAAEIVAEIGNINRFSKSDKLARYSGIAPINYSSGKQSKEIRNEQGNRQLNRCIFALAIRNISPGNTKENPTNPIFIEYYHKKISEGKNKQQALTCVMRRLINIIYRMMVNKTEFILPQELADKCKNSYLEKIKEEKLKQENKNVT